MRQNKHPHLYNRNGQYYFRYRFNKEASTVLFRQEIWKSLNTSDIDKAAEKCLRLCRNAKSLEQMVGEMSKGKKLTKKLANDLVQLYFAEEYQANGFNNEWPELDLELALGEEQKIKTDLVKQLNQMSYPIDEFGDAEQYLLSYGIELPKAEPQYWKDYVQGTLRARLEVYRIFLAKIKGNYNEAGVQDELFKANFSLNNTAPPQLAKPMKNVSEFLNDYTLDKQEDWTIKTQEEITQVLGEFFELLPDKPFNEIERPHMREVKNNIALIPTNMSKFSKFKGLSIKKAIALDNNETSINVKTAMKRWDTIKAYMTWICNETGRKNVTTGLTIKDKSDPKNKRTPYTLDELITVFNSPIYKRKKPKQNANYWVPLISLYSGLRLAEIIQMEICDIRKEDDIWIFDINTTSENGILKSVKTKTSKRKVPIHSKLILMGFLDFHQQCHMRGYLRVFDDIKRSANESAKGNYSDIFSARYVRVLEKLGVKREKLSFHSFRHSVVSKLHVANANGVYIRYVLGHTQHVEDKTYGEYELPPAKECVEMINYDGLNLDHLIKKKS